MRLFYIPLLCLLLCLGTLCKAQDSLSVIHLTDGVNTVGNEVAPTMLINNRVLFSYLPHSTNEHRLELDAILMQIMEATVADDGTLVNARAIQKGPNSNYQHTGNTAYDKQNHRVYFTRCDVADKGQAPCQIYTATLQGNNWRNITKLKGDVNLDGYTSTHPAIGHFDGQTVLFFVSNRPGGLGGMDLWYTTIENNKCQEVINLGGPVNTTYDEITPFYDDKLQVLYFSSNRPGGHGDYDIYASHGFRNSYCKPVPMAPPINSPKNDLYYTISKDDGTQGYLSSNRTGAYFTVDSFCCNDIFMWHIDTAIAPTDVPAVQKTRLTEGDKPVDVPSDKPVADNAKPSEKDTTSIASDEPTKQPDPPAPVTKPRERVMPTLPPPPSLEKLESLEPSDESPIVLYFHNDIPDPGSRSSHTTQSYDQTVQSYLNMRPRYKAAWAGVCDRFGCDSVGAILDYFFDYEVKFNYDRLNEFVWKMAEELWNDHKVTLTVRGFASPLHTSDYNALLSQRRIDCLLNYLRKWNSGNLRHSIAEGMLTIIEAPYGSNSAPSTVSNNFNDAVHSVYSVEAARERRVEIIKMTTE